MSLQFNTSLVTHKSTAFIDATVEVNKGNNCLTITYTTLDGIRYSKNIPFDLDIIDILSIRMDMNYDSRSVAAHCDAVLTMSGTIRDNNVIKKLRSGTKFYNRELFFTILEQQLNKEYLANQVTVNYESSNKNYKILELGFKGVEFPFFKYQQRYLSWILDIEMDILNKNNGFYVPDDTSIRTPAISYDISKQTISFLKHNDVRFINYINFKGCGIVLDECLGKSTIAAGLIGMTSLNPNINYGQIIDEKYIISKATLVVCDISDIKVYLKVLNAINHSIDIKVITNEKDYKNLSYLNAVSCDVILLSFQFFTVLRNSSDLYEPGVEREHLQEWYYSDLLKDDGIFEKTKPELSLIKFKRLIIDSCDISRCLSKIKSLRYETILILGTSINDMYQELFFDFKSKYNARYVQNLIKFEGEPEEILRDSYTYLPIHTLVPYSLSIKEKILLKIYKMEYEPTRLENFLISPKEFCEYSKINTVITTQDKVGQYLRQSGKYSVQLCETVECPICFKENLEDKIITFCGHTFCCDCLVKSLYSKGNCPICRAMIEDNGYIHLVPDDSGSYSSKIDKILDLLNEQCLRDSQSIIYCESKFVAAIIANALKGINYKFSDSSLTKKKSSIVIKNFIDNQTKGVLLISQDTFHGKYDFKDIENVIVVDNDRFVLAANIYTDPVLNSILKRITSIGSSVSTNILRLSLEN